MHYEDEVPQLIFDFRIGKSWGFNEDSPRHVVYIKRWQALVKKDMQTLFADEIEPNLYAVDAFFWENIFERKTPRKNRSNPPLTVIEKILGETCSPHHMKKLTEFILRWSRMGEQARSDIRSLWGNDLSEEQRKSAYLGWYEKDNIPNRMYNSGSIEDDSFVYSQKIQPSQPKIFYTAEDFNDAVSSQSDQIRQNHIVIRKVLIWLASVEGQNFTNGCERNIEIKGERESALRFPQYSKHSPVQKWLVQRP
jgi:hypothetical protein